MSVPTGGHRVFAALYDRVLDPVERRVLGPRRAALVSGLTGRVLDVGAGTGANLPHYRDADEVIALEPDPAMRRRLHDRAGSCAVPLTVSGAGADALPATDGSVDAVVFTLVLCTVPDPARALGEAHRVLRPGGRLVAIEHVVGQGRPATWRRRLAPAWERVAAGCRLDRDTEAAVTAAGFVPGTVERFPATPSWGPIGAMVQLTATRA